MIFRLALVATLSMAWFACGEVTETPDAGGSTIDGDGIPDGPAPDADPCSIHTCECDTDADCSGAHEFCDTSGPGRVCACVAGYDGDPCAWAGAPADPGFGDGASWTASDGANVSPGSTGSVDAGEVLFNPSAICQMGRVTQTFEMPPYEKAEPLVAEVTHQALGGDDFDRFSAAVGLGRAWVPFERSATGWTTERFCLGEAAYGGDVEFGVSVSEKAPGCPDNATGSIAVDHFGVKVANPGECPAPGTALNGDAEGTGGWEFSSSGTGATAGFVGGAGQAGTRGARIAITTNCTSARMSFRVSVPSPESMPSPALQFYWKGTADVAFPLEIGPQRRRVDHLVGTGGAQTATYCLPPWTQGRVIDVASRVSGVAGSCADPLNRELILDDVVVVSESSCGTPVNSSAPGFEFAPIRPFGASITNNEFQEVRTLASSSAAHSGSGVLELVNGMRCYDSSYQQFLWVPPSDENGGPAVVFWSDIGDNAVTIPRYSGGLGGEVVNGELTEGGGWKESTVCLDPDWAARWYRFSVRLDGGSGTCTGFGSTERGRFDDFTVTTDSSCPTE